MTLLAGSLCFRWKLSSDGSGLDVSETLLKLVSLFLVSVS